jgi:hypothetical protein
MNEEPPIACDDNGISQQVDVRDPKEYAIAVPVKCNYIETQKVKR